MKKFIFVLMLLTGIFSLYAKEITVSVGAGEHWKQKREPQLAVWLEDADGNFLRTLYVTERASHISWIMSPKEGRPESLPVWYNASGHGSSKVKADSKKGEALLDAVTSATPKGGIVFNTEIENRVYIIKAEFNTSFDYNNYYTKKNSCVNGQPSVIYSAIIPADFGKGSEEVRLSFAGCGSIDGSDGKVHSDTANLTTARQIVKLVAVAAK